MILVPTRACNTNSCNYCGVYRKDFEYRYFADFDVADFYDKTFFLSTHLQDFNLRFFWGEPLLTFDVIEKIISHFRERSDKFSFAINTNLLLLDDRVLHFAKDHSVKLIVSCNGDVMSHSKSRGISIHETMKTYENIIKMTSHNIDHQINVVVQNDTAEHLEKNLSFIAHTLGWKHINLLPVNYIGWRTEGLLSLEKSLSGVKAKMRSGELDIRFINKEVENEVSLFNSEFVIDSDGQVYPSMVILEKFFLEEKKKILVSSMTKDLGDIKNDMMYWENENHRIYSLFINKILKNKFPDIIEKDSASSEIFHRFLMEI